MPKKKKTSKVQKAQVKIRDLKPKKDAKGGFAKIERPSSAWKVT
jgi:hypothetical protein